jgi:AcrR family transcriptional regulator
MTVLRTSQLVSCTCRSCGYKLTKRSDLTKVSNNAINESMVALDRQNRADRRRLRTRSALISAAREVFGAKGVQATTIQDITDAADVAKGSFYNHFHDAGEILRAVVEETLSDLGEQLKALTGGLRDDPARVIAVSLRYTLRVCTEDPTIGWFILSAGDLMGVTSVALGPHGRRDLEIGIETGRFRCDDLDLITAIIGGGAQAVVRRRLVGELPAEAEGRFVAHALRMLGVTEDEAAAIAGEELPPLESGTHPTTPSQIQPAKNQ